MKDKLRTVRLSPYLKGKGPTWTLTTFDTGRTDRVGKSELAYELRQVDNGKSSLLFEGDKFFCSPCYAIDSDEAVGSLLTFLTLRPGDTDAEYFEAYTPAQLEYCAKHAESLSCYCSDRFGEV